MGTSDYYKYFSEHLSNMDFEKLSSFIQDHMGIKMPDGKKSMIEGRLRKRLRAVKVKRFTEYCEYLFSPEGMASELSYFIDVITTNKTDFFREPAHFKFLVNKAVPDLIRTHGAGVNKKLQIWSAAASTGNEAYTISMVLSEFAAKYPGIRLDFSILATDISMEVLEEAKKGIYPGDAIQPVPMELRMKYLLRSKDKKKNLVRIVPEIRYKVKFRHLNLMDKDYRFREFMDVIFCRNVIIYFNRETQDDLIFRLCKNLRLGGYLFMGHSEVLHSRDLPLKAVAPSVYCKVA